MTALRVLVVDDDYRVAGIHAAYVDRTEGFAVVGQAHTAAEARELAAQLQPELVLMDIYLPDGDGLEVVRDLLDSQHPPAVLVISAARDLAAVRAAMQLGAVHYLIKPFGYQALAERLSAYERLHRRMGRASTETMQSEVDELFELSRASGTARPGKGHSAPTIELVRNAVRASSTAVSAVEISERVGISRATAQRYLSYLERHGVLKLQLRYGSTGRPENRYQIRGG
jgi:response regulator of citrate/malate metabolism